MKHENEIICGDCLEVMKDWPDGCVDLVLTDPPYNLGKKYGDATNDNMSPQKYRKWFNKRMSEIFRVCGTGYLYLSHSDKGIYKVKPDLEKIGFNYIQTLVWWGKNGYSMQLHRRSWSYRHELILFMCKGEPEVLSAGESGDWYTSVIETPRPQSNFKAGRFHPTQKPLLLYWRYIKRTPGTIILDPFCGSGTTCVAAKMLGRRYIGIDISEEYCQIARDRLRAVDTGVPVKEARAGQGALFER